MTGMDDTQLEKVSGGFEETTEDLKGITFGMDIICPACGAKDRDNYM